MNLWIRCFLVWVSSFWRPRLRLNDTSVLNMMVLPNDLDVYAHMNNGRYLTVMDLGRIDLILRTHLGKIAVKKKWNPIVASNMMQYRRSLTVFDRYQLKTRILCWDAKWIFLEQRFEHKGRLVALGYVKGLFMHNGRKVPNERVFKQLHLGKFESPPIPKEIELWQAADSSRRR